MEISASSQCLLRVGKKKNSWLTLSLDCSWLALGCSSGETSGGLRDLFPGMDLLQVAWCNGFRVRRFWMNMGKRCKSCQKDSNQGRNGEVPVKMIPVVMFPFSCMHHESSIYVLVLKQFRRCGYTLQRWYIQGWTSLTYLPPGRWQVQCAVVVRHHGIRWLILNDLPLQGTIENFAPLNGKHWHCARCRFLARTTSKLPKWDSDDTWDSLAVYHWSCVPSHGSVGWISGRCSTVKSSGYIDS